MPGLPCMHAAFGASMCMPTEWIVIGQGCLVVHHAACCASYKLPAMPARPSSSCEQIHTFMLHYNYTLSWTFFFA